MNADDYFWKTKKRPLKTKPRSKPLPKAKEKYLEAEEDFEHALKEHQMLQFLKRLFCIHTFDDESDIFVQAECWHCGKAKPD